MPVTENGDGNGKDTRESHQDGLYHEDGGISPYPTAGSSPDSIILLIWHIYRGRPVYGYPLLGRFLDCDGEFNRIRDSP